jgi:hypothetical protein
MPFPLFDTDREFAILSARWLRRCEKMLDRIRELEEVEGKDRLDLVRSMHFALYALHGSLKGWMRWVNNSNIMTKFTKEELEDVDRELSELTHTFLVYDLEVTEKEAETARKAVGKRREEIRAFYV